MITYNSNKYKEPSRMNLSMTIRKMYLKYMTIREMYLKQRFSGRIIKPWPPIPILKRVHLKLMNGSIKSKQ